MVMRDIRSLTGIRIHLVLDQIGNDFRLPQLGRQSIRGENGRIGALWLLLIQEPSPSFTARYQPQMGCVPLLATQSMPRRRASEPWLSGGRSLIATRTDRACFRMR